MEPGTKKILVKEAGPGRGDGDPVRLAGGSVRDRLAGQLEAQQHQLDRLAAALEGLWASTVTGDEE